MNKTLRYSFICALMAVCGLMQAQTTVTFDATVDKSDVVEAAEKVSITKDGITIQLTKGILGNGENYRCYKNETMTVSSTVGNIVKINFTCTASGTAKYGPGCFIVENGNYTYEEKAGTWTGDAASVNFKAETNQVRMTKIDVTYLKSGETMKDDPKLAFSENTVTVTIGNEFTAPVLTKATTADVTYSSKNETVATVDAKTGDVKILAPGTTVITAKAEANDTYAAGSASYTLIVNDVVRTEVDEPYTETFETGIGSFTIDNVNISEGLTYVWNHNAEYKYMKASAYFNKTNYATESWLISPVIVLSSAEVIRSLSFDQCVSKFFGNVAEEATLWIKEQGGEWKQFTITYPEVPADKSFSSFETQTVSLAGYEGKKIQVGFKYTSTATAAGTWEIKNVKVSTGTETGINDMTVKTVPADGAIYNMAGQRLDKPQKGINIKNGKKFVVK